MASTPLLHSVESLVPRHDLNRPTRAANGRRGNVAFNRRRAYFRYPQRSHAPYKHTATRRACGYAPTHPSLPAALSVRLLTPIRRK